MQHDPYKQLTRMSLDPKKIMTAHIEKEHSTLWLSQDMEAIPRPVAIPRHGGGNLLGSSQGGTESSSTDFTWSRAKKPGSNRSEKTASGETLVHGRASKDAQEESGGTGTQKHYEIGNNLGSGVAISGAVFGNSYQGPLHEIQELNNSISCTEDLFFHTKHTSSL
uniref:Uncharacterized protein n=1 Tax=Sphaerodactylus townsendi TaxID=933632 RepID=A0ACB8FLK9_9SAUR